MDRITLSFINPKSGKSLTIAESEINEHLQKRKNLKSMPTLEHFLFDKVVSNFLEYYSKKKPKITLDTRRNCSILGTVNKGEDGRETSINPLVSMPIDHFLLLFTNQCNGNYSKKGKRIFDYLTKLSNRQSEKLDIAQLVTTLDLGEYENDKWPDTLDGRLSETGIDEFCLISFRVKKDKFMLVM